MTQLRNACVTWNNYTPADILKITSWDQITYGVYGEEIGEKGTPHLQCYFEFKSSKKFATLHKFFEKNHIELRKGTPKAAAGYCMKGVEELAEGENFEKFYDNPSETWLGKQWGNIGEQGKRTDIESCVDLIKDGKRMREVAETYPVAYVKFHKGFHSLQAQLITPRNGEITPEIICYYGLTGRGKTHKARQDMAAEDYWIWTPQCGHWFDRYQGERCAIFDEFRGQLPLGHLLNITDKFECPNQFKGGFIEFAATKIIFTSPKHPRDWYKDDDSDKIDQLLSRFTTITEFKGFNRRLHVGEASSPAE